MRAVPAFQFAPGAIVDAIGWAVKLLRDGQRFDGFQLLLPELGEIVLGL
jgi:hypothetical protein